MKQHTFFATAVLIGLCLTPCGSWGQSTAGAAPPSRADYEAAAKLLLPNLEGLVRNQSVLPHWIGNDGRFWYQRDGQDGPEFVVVTSKGEKLPAFDHQVLARALYTAIGKEQPGGKGLPASLTDVRLSDDLTKLSGKLAGKVVDCSLKTEQCRLSDVPPATPELLLSPDGRQALLTRDNNLFVRDLREGQNRALTTDGVPLFSWATVPYYSSFQMMTELKAGVKNPPFQTYWSPDGRYVIAPRIDERDVKHYPYLEGVPTNGSLRPIVHNVLMPFPGDRATVGIEYFLFDLNTGKRTAIKLPEGYPEFSWAPHWPPVLGWSRSRGQAFILSRTRGWKSAAVFRVDLATGKVTKVIEESAATRFEFHNLWGPSNVRLIGDGAEVIWYSDRTGWGHLYLYDAQTGRLKGAITDGDWVVQDMLAIDEAHREIYFTGEGREAGVDPYYRQLYRASLDGGEINRLTEADAEHSFDRRGGGLSYKRYVKAEPSPLINPSAGVFVDNWSTVDRPPVSELRSTRDGRLIAVLERADASRLFAAGYAPPKRERVKAADGKTDLYADYYAPQGVAVGAKYPVIDLAYNGAASAVTPRSFTQGYRASTCGGPGALTQLGFAVVIVDGRGTAMRSSAFRDAGYPEFTQVGIDDHAAAIRQLTQRHPEIDIERVGVCGNSWGGTFAAQAILSRPEFYKVAVSAAGVYNHAAIYDGYAPYLDIPVYADGSQYRTHPGEVPVNWNKVDITQMAARLQGHLLITYGDADEQVTSNQAKLLIEALTRANKPYDLIYYPNGDHSHLYTSYVMKRAWDYFVLHLRGAEPVRDFKIGREGNLRAP